MIVLYLNCNLRHVLFFCFSLISWLISDSSNIQSKFFYVVFLSQLPFETPTSLAFPSWEKTPTHRKWYILFLKLQPCTSWMCLDWKHSKISGKYTKYTNVQISYLIVIAPKQNAYMFNFQQIMLWSILIQYVSGEMQYNVTICSWRPTCGSLIVGTCTLQCTA